LNIKYYQNVIFIVLEYLVNSGLDNLVLLIFQKDCDNIESGLGLEHDLYKNKYSRFSQAVWSLSTTEFLLVPCSNDVYCLCFWDHAFENLAKFNAFLYLRYLEV